MNRTGWHRTLSAPLRDQRGQSEVLGFILILGLTIGGTAAIVLYGSPALSDTQETIEISSAEHAMTELDSKISLVGFDNSPSQQVDLGIRGTGATTRVDDTSGHIKIVRVDSDGNSVELLNRNLGAIVYENGDTTIAYQGGGVWKRTGGGSTMVSPPEFHYRGTTLTLPLITVTGDDTITNRVQVTSSGQEPVFPIDGDKTTTNPLAGDEVTITVTSQYYQAWGQFFAERTGGTPDYDPELEQVTLTVVAPDNTNPLANGVVSTSPARKMHINGQQGEVFIDTYDSSVGPYTSGGSEGTIATSGGVDMQHGTFDGNLVSGGGEVRLKTTAHITGDVAYGGTLSTDKAPSDHIDGTITNDGATATVNPVDGFITQKQKTIRNDEDANIDPEGDPNTIDSDIDDHGTTNVTDDTLDASQDAWTLNHGTYYLETIDLESGDKLTLDNTDGPIEIYVDNDFKLNGATLKVVNELGSPVRIYVDHKFIEIKGDSRVAVPDQRSTKLWVYGGQDTHIRVEDDNTSFVGVIYAPSADTSSGDVVLRDEAHLYGAVVGGEMRLTSGVNVHYDETLKTANPIPGGNEVTLTYLHITVNKVDVTDE